jgi:hypothetical protein
MDQPEPTPDRKAILPPIRLSPDEAEAIVEQLDEPDPGDGGGDEAHKPTGWRRGSAI